MRRASHEVFLTDPNLPIDSDHLGMRAAGDADRAARDGIFA